VFTRASLAETETQGKNLFLRQCDEFGGASMMHKLLLNYANKRDNMDATKYIYDQLERDEETLIRRVVMMYMEQRGRPANYASHFEINKVKIGVANVYQLMETLGIKLLPNGFEFPKEDNTMKV
jgi:hypothetical protein